MPVQLKFSEEARVSILKGAEILSRAVVSTLGPWGRNAIIRRHPVVNKDGSLVYLPPVVTKDGVTVARKVTSLPDPFEDMGAQIVKEAAERTNRLAGDGTTTATLLAYEMMQDGIKLLEEGKNAIHIKRGMQKACEMVCKQLQSMKREVDGLEDYKSIATLSAAGDEEIGSMVALAVDEVGKNGALTIANGMGTGLEYKITNGMQISVGYTSHHFAGAKGVATVEDSYVLVTTEKIVSIRSLAPVLASISERHEERVHLTIFSTGVDGDALATIVENQLKHPEKFRFLVLKAPFYGERQQQILEDIAIATGATLIEKKLGRSVENMSVKELGKTGRVDATAHVTTITNPERDNAAVQKRIAFIQSILETAETDAEKDYLKMRIAALEGKIATILVGGSSYPEQQEKQHRVEDAIAATRAAQESGILPGGGVAYLRCLSSITELVVENDSDESYGAKIVQDVLSKQLHWIAKNAGENPEEVIENVLHMKEHEGFNAETGEYGDLFTMKIIDPTKVPITALRNAVSVAGMFLTAEVAIAEDDPVR